MKWKLKALVQGVLARVPFGTKANDALQRAIGGRRNLAEHIDSKFQADWLVHMDNLKRLGAIALASGRDAAQVKAQWQTLMHEPDGASVLRRAGINYQAPAAATRSGLVDRSVDLVFSNSVLEHVPAGVLDALMHETRRLLTADGIALHGVNCGDHYAYFDRSITPIHYLRFSSQQRRLWNNDLLYRNRLRPIDFIESARRAGLPIVTDTHKPRADLLGQIGDLPIAAEFRHYEPDQLYCTSVDFAARLPS